MLYLTIISSSSWGKDDSGPPDESANNDGVVMAACNLQQPTQGWYREPTGPLEWVVAPFQFLEAASSTG
eukprot:scaffold4810_cov98-Skeletonema_menzelii.AAC.3